MGQQAFVENHLWYVSYLLYLCLHAEYLQLTELLQNLNILPLTPPKGSGGGVKF